MERDDLFYEIELYGSVGIGEINWGDFELIEWEMPLGMIKFN